MFMLLSSWQNHCGSPGSFDMNVERRQAAVDPQTKPNDLGCESACRLPELYTHHHHLLLLFSPKADTHSTIPRMVEDWVDLVGWLHTEMVQPPTDGHSPQY